MTGCDPPDRASSVRPSAPASSRRSGSAPRIRKLTRAIDQHHGQSGQGRFHVAGMAAAEGRIAGSRRTAMTLTFRTFAAIAPLATLDRRNGFRPYGRGCGITRLSLWGDFGGNVFVAGSPMRHSAQRFIPDCAGKVRKSRRHACMRVEKRNGALILSDGRAVLLEGIRLPRTAGPAAHADGAVAAAGAGAEGAGHLHRHAAQAGPL